MGEAPAPPPSSSSPLPLPSSRQLRVTNLLHSVAVAAALAAPRSLPAEPLSAPASSAPASSSPAPVRIVEIKWSELVPDLSVRGFPKFGGFGAVFVARWTSKRKLVAVKVLKSAMLSASQSIAAVEMLMHEAQGLMRASDNGVNAHVVQVFGVAQGVAEGWQSAQRTARAAEGQMERRKRAHALRAHKAGAAAAAAAGDADASTSANANSVGSSGNSGGAGAGASSSSDSGGGGSSGSGSGSGVAGAASGSSSDHNSGSHSAEGPDNDSEDEADAGVGAATAAAVSAADAADGPAPYLFGLIMSFESGGSLQESLFPKRQQAAWPSTMLDRLRVLKEVRACESARDLCAPCALHARMPACALTRPFSVPAQVATGLYQLHAIGLVHGDLKLDNVSRSR